MKNIVKQILAEFPLKKSNKKNQLAFIRKQKSEKSFQAYFDEKKNYINFNQQSQRIISEKHFQTNFPKIKKKIIIVKILELFLCLFPSVSHTNLKKR